MLTPLLTKDSASNVYSWPGPNLGYSNCSIKDVSTFLFFFLNGFVIAFQKALDKDKPLTL